MSLIHIKLKSNVEIVGVAASNTVIGQDTRFITIDDIQFIQYEPNPNDGSMSARLIPFSPISPTGKFSFSVDEILAYTNNPSDELAQMFVQATTGLDLSGTV